MAVIGAATILLAGTSALAQRDLKRALAYSTMSQIGYMFLALGVQAWQPAIFHFATHAFFKALLFLSAGVVIHALDGEQDMLRMGGLWRRLPVSFWTFLVACLSMAALPPLTAGFFSKDWILYAVYESPRAGHLAVGRRRGRGDAHLRLHLPHALPGVPGPAARPARRARGGPTAKAGRRS